MKHLFKKMHYGKKEKQKIIFCMFCCPLCFVSPGQAINLFIVKRRKRCFPSRNAQTIEMGHMHEH